MAIKLVPLMNDYKKINKNWKAQENALGYY